MLALKFMPCTESLGERSSKQNSSDNPKATQTFAALLILAPQFLGLFSQQVRHSIWY